MPLTLTDKDLSDVNKLAEKIMDLSSIVYTRHYYASSREKEDLISVGVVKALSLIQGGGWDKSKGRLINYLYSGIRNEMHNYLYKVNKEVCFEEFYEDYKEDSYFDDEVIHMDFKVIQEVCNRFKCYSGLCREVAEDLESRGFIIVNNSKGEPKGYSNIKDTYGEEFYKDLISRLSGAVIWKSLEYCH